MTDVPSWVSRETKRLQLLLIAHGAGVLFIGLLAGFMLVFAMLEGFILWPILDIPYELPGSVRGWATAHVGGITNGLLLIGIALVFTKMPIALGKIRFMFWSFMLTGWGNTIFYWAANLSQNRGISVQSNRYGESDLAGIVAFVSGGSVMLLTTIATAMIAMAAYQHSKNLAK